MVVYKKGLAIILSVALAAGIVALLISAVFASYIFMILSLPNFGLAAFFGYKYFTLERASSSKQRRSKKI
jgi:hypothetical protein